MKPINTALCLAIAVLPLCAADAQVTLSTTQAPQQEDSPLVRAAKMANHGPMKSTWVITNENLLRLGGHIAVASQSIAQVPTGTSTSTQQQPQSAPQPPQAQPQPQPQNAPPLAVPQANNAKPGPQALPQMPITTGLPNAPVQPLKPPQ